MLKPLSPPARTALAAAAGVSTIVALPPWSFALALFAGLSLLYVLLCGVQRARAAFALGWLFGFGYFTGGLAWIGNALLVDGNDFAWLWPLAVAGLPALLAFFPAAACALAVKSAPLHSAAGFCALVAALTASEWLRGHILTGFPWNLYGSIWADISPMAQLAAPFGLYGLTLLTVFWGAFPGFLWRWRENAPRKILLAGCAILTGTGAFLYGQQRLETHPTVLREDVLIRLVQPGTRQQDKWDPSKRAVNFRTLLDLSIPNARNREIPTLIVWPETAVSDATLDAPAAHEALRGVLAAYGQGGAYLLTGLLRQDTGTDGKLRYYNSLSLFDSALHPLSHYNKSHLVPFGEYIPFQSLIPFGPIATFAAFTPGHGPQNAVLPEIASYSPLVCYEIIFSGAVTGENGRPGFIVNVTNDAWYGDSAGPRQHFAQTRFRAIEEGLPIVRAANTGISGIIDPLGRTVTRTDLFAAAGLNAPLPAALPATPYARFGDAPFFAALSILGGLAFFLKRHR